MRGLNKKRREQLPRWRALLFAKQKGLCALCEAHRVLEPAIQVLGQRRAVGHDERALEPRGLELDELLLGLGPRAAVDGAAARAPGLVTAHRHRGDPAAVLSARHAALAVGAPAGHYRPSAGDGEAEAPLPCLIIGPTDAAT